MLHYYFQSGIGRPVTGEEGAAPWTDDQLATALAGIDIAVDRRSIQSWLSGSSIPKVQNLKGLATLASSNRFERERWSAAFIRLRRKALDERRDQRARSQAAETPSAAPRPTERKKRLTRPAATLAALTLVGGMAYALVETFGPEPPVATNIRFCDEANFSKETKQCLREVTAFPDGLHTLMITFDLPGVERGETFIRKWYRNGRLIHEKSSFNDEAWPGYTFWHWPEGFDTGEYALQIVSDGRTVSRTFHVGEGDGRLRYR
ncbi:hypothetical protein [Henriciella aquimarina]|uniref:hypothetical protein n=1 Tax=Henriciella aquimarina TaxID=545261 RepID=UPI0009FC22F7|nr:hypothetical protein [Henriciella aquimarina]